jgi:N-acyl homoserine lactone hydrolase
MISAKNQEVTSMKPWSLLPLACLLFLLTGLCLGQNPKAGVSLYRLEGGTSWMNDLGRFCDVFSYHQKPGTLTVSAFLIKHNDDYLIWDTGLPAATKGSKLDRTQATSREMTKTLTDQLQEINVAADQINYVAVSHYHTDHIGQASSFPQAKLLVGDKDWSVLQQADTKGREFVEHWLSGKGEVQTVSGDLDIFGDGSVLMFATPGHTPGHHSLLIKLPETGTVLLTGDLVHMQESFDNDRVPAFNTSRAETLASLDRFKRLAKHWKALVIIQHEPENMTKLPLFPEAAR